MGRVRIPEEYRFRYPTFRVMLEDVLEILGRYRGVSSDLDRAYRLLKSLLDFTKPVMTYDDAVKLRWWRSGRETDKIALVFLPRMYVTMAMSFGVLSRCACVPTQTCPCTEWLEQGRCKCSIFYRLEDAEDVFRLVCLRGKVVIE